ncbi:MAG: helix-turn-helix domain-containing protein [Clostridiales bacterium]|nr:helix-turn-helix domain-containing protein [Clostridiales bacterium]
MLEVSNIKTNIVLLRKSGKVSQRQLADFLHVSPQTISGWENGYFNPDIPQLISLANYFKVQIDGLFEDKKSELERDYDVTPETIGATIAEWRKAKELTQKDLADKLFVSPQAVSRWERGQGFPDLAIFPQICELLGVSLHRLLCGENGIKKESEEGSGKLGKKPLLIIIISSVVALLAIVGMIIGIVLGTRNSDGGTNVAPPDGTVIFIGSYDEFTEHADSFTDASAIFVLTADINAEGHKTIDGFNATLDGKGYTVSGLSTPFIRNMYGGARISNVHFDISITATVGLNDRVGGVAVTNYGYMESVWVSGKIDLPGQRYIGGVIGSNYGNLRNIENSAEIICADYAGGIVGYNNGIIAFGANNGAVASLLGSPVSDDDPTLIKHSGSIAGYVGSGVQLNGCITTVSNIDDRNPLYGQTNSSVDFSLSVLVTPDMLDQALFEWLNYNPNNGDLYDGDNIPVNMDEAIWYDNTGKWVRVGDKPRLAIFHAE